MKHNLLATIGNTPLVKIPLLPPASLYAKLEYLNPGGSIKDRSALYMIETAERAGLLHPGSTIVEASSGNQGIALAMIGAIKGYKVIITTSEKISREKLQTLRAYGAHVIVCPVTKHIQNPNSYYSTAKKIAASIKDAYSPDQFFNTQNIEAHYQGLGAEIWRQTSGKVTYVFAAAGTGGTISGIGKFLKEQNPQIKIIAVDAATSFYSTRGHPAPYKLEGIGIDFKSPCLDETMIDAFVSIADAQGTGMLKTLAVKYGFLVGPSSGAVAFAAQTYANKFTENDMVVLIFGDSGRAYLSKNYL